MRYSTLFGKTLKNAPKDEVTINAKLLIRGGFIHKEMAGVYAFLPLGLRVLEKINRIIREEMDAIDGQEIQMTALQDKDIWEKTNRWNDKVVDSWFKTKLKNDTEVGLGFTHEEPLTSLVKKYVTSYRDLPLYLYQIQTKFRNETRSKSGLIRGREFLMKDLYSFSRDQKEHEEYYEKVKKAYMVIFDRMGIGNKTYLTFASGGTFSKYSHEFQTLTEAGEDTIYICEDCHFAVNDEIINEQDSCPQCKKKDLISKKAVEVGNIFSLGTRFSQAFGLFYTDERGENKPVVMGSYGIGPGRLMGTIVELLSDEKGIVWPEAVTPYQVYLIGITNSSFKASGDKQEVRIKERVEDIYKRLTREGIEVLYDDREDVSAGAKFADADLIGITVRLVVSEKTLRQGSGQAEDKVEWKERRKKETEILSLSEVVNRLKG